MSAQDIIMGSRVAHVRELKAEIEKLKADNAALRDELTSLKAHFDKALLAAVELREGEPLEIWDGWNLILGAKKEGRDRDDLIAQAQTSGRRVWIVLDGPEENVRLLGANVRVSYTGGTGEHRADKFICDYVRMAKYLGLADRVIVRTSDKDFRQAIRRMGAALRA